jgi:hypothetical protein
MPELAHVDQSQCMVFVEPHEDLEIIQSPYSLSKGEKQ